MTRRAYLILLTVTVVVWTTVLVFRVIFGWIARDSTIRTSGIPNGPGFLEGIAFASSKRPHIIFMAWMKAFGPIFWFRMGPYHVSC
jgi:hypothetical protein